MKHKSQNIKMENDIRVIYDPGNKGSTRTKGDEDIMIEDAEEEADILQVGNFLIDMNRILGKGEYGTVYLA